MPASTPLPPSGKTAETNGKKPQIWVISDGTAGMRLQAIALGEALIATDTTNQTSLADIIINHLGGFGICRGLFLSCQRHCYHHGLGQLGVG